LPANTLTFSLDPGAPALATVGAVSGVFSWTPGLAEANTINPISVRVTDNGSPLLSDVKSFVVTVAPAPFIQSIVVSNDVVTLTWTAIAGQIYRVQHTSDLIGNSWTNLPPDVTAVGSTASKSDSIGAAVQKFYRVQVLP
jgi:hypothetical protein